MPQAYHSIWTQLLATPFRQGWIDAGGIKTRFVQAGDPSNPPLVMLHGTAGSLENFAANITAHAQHFNCVAFESGACCPQVVKANARAAGSAARDGQPPLIAAGLGVWSRKVVAGSARGRSGPASRSDTIMRS